ncbi:hypothetical protein AC249_AIPGENE81, partial [Exaiptasia diaphana]
LPWLFGLIIFGPMACRGCETGDILGEWCPVLGVNAPSYAISPYT